MKLLASCCFLIFLFFSCSKRSGAISEDVGSLFDLQYRDTACHIDIFHPDRRDSVLFHYTLTRPFQHFAVTSAPQVGFLKALGKLDGVVAASTPHLMYNLSRSDIIDIGEDTHLNIERLLLSGADVLFVTWYGQRLHNEDIIRQAGVEVVYMLEWKEVQPLLRAKWVELVGACVGESKRADALYKAICFAYEQYKCSIQDTVVDRVSVLCGSPFGGVWYLPAGGTYMASLLNDAGVDYPYFNDKRNISLPLSIEKVISTFELADVWIGANANTKQELCALNSKLSWLKAYKTNRVYNFYKQTRSSGANNYWEDGIVHPEYVLHDITSVAYQHFFSDSVYYFASSLK